MEMVDRTKWFVEARFGMFIHWGMWDTSRSSVRWIVDVEPMPVGAVKEFERLALRWNPKKYRPGEWVELAQEAGMRYMVLTTRSPFGFALFDSEVSDFTAAKTGPKRDLVAEFADACRSRDMRIGFYYPLADHRYQAWAAGPEEDPDGWAEYLKYLHTQVEELCSKYGKIDILWYDACEMAMRSDGWVTRDPELWQTDKLNALVRRLQPNILINNRSGPPEDFDTPEQRIPVLWRQRLMDRNFDPNRPWETCMTMSDSWGYRPRQKWKSTKQLIQDLARCAEGGGNYLLNVGPKPDGTFPQAAVRRLKEIGGWMKVNGESIYGTEPCPFRGSGVGVTTAKGNTAYLHVTRWPDKEVSLIGVKNKVLSARLLATGREVDVHQEGYRVFLTGLPDKAPDPYNTVIAMKMDGKPQSYPISFLCV